MIKDETSGFQKFSILHIIVNLGTGGAEAMLYKLLGCMDEQKFSHSVVVLMGEAVYGPRLKNLGIPVYALQMQEGRTSLRSIYQLRKIVRSVSPDLIQGWMYHGNLAAYAAKWFADDQTLFCWNIRQTLYSLRNEKSLTRLIIKICAHLSRAPVSIIYNSTISAEQHEGLGYAPASRIVIPNGFDTDIFRPSSEKRVAFRAELAVSDEEILVGTVARFHPMKDHRSLIEAADIVSRKTQNVKFVFVGAGANQTEPALMNELQQRNLLSSFYLLGERHDIANILSGFDIFVLPSAWGEGFPNAVGEAMACQLPCIVTDVGESATVVDKYGIVVPPSNPEALASAIIEMMEKSEIERRNIGWAARQRVKEVYSLPKITEEYERLYKNALAALTQDKPTGKLSTS